MPRFAAFLRGINVTGRRVTNEGLRGCLDELGFDDVATFRASGNLILDVPGRAAPATVARRVERALEASLGYAVPVFLRDEAQMRALAAEEPFGAAELAASQGRVQIALLASEPAAAARARVLALASEHDRLAVVGSELHWLPRGGMAESVLDLQAIERALGAFTVRTKGTIDQIATRWFAA